MSVKPLSIFVSNDDLNLVAYQPAESITLFRSVDTVFAKGISFLS